MKLIPTLVILMCLPLIGTAQNLSYTEDTTVSFGYGAYGSCATADTDGDGIIDEFTYNSTQAGFMGFAPVLVGENLDQNNGVFNTGNLPFTKGQFDAHLYEDFDNNGTYEYVHFYADENYLVDDGNGHPLSEAHMEFIVESGSGYSLPTNHGLPAVAQAIAFTGHYDSDNLKDIFVDGVILDVNDIDNDGDVTDRARYAAWYKNNGDLTFTLMQTFVGLARASGVSGNIDGSYGDDIIYTGTNVNGSSRMYYLENNGSGFNVTELNSSNGWTPFIDGDMALGYNNPDAPASYIAMSGGYGNNDQLAEVRKNNGSGLFTEILVAPFESMIRCTIVFTHSDDDGLVDIYAQGRATGDVLHADVYRNINGTDFDLQCSFPGLKNGFATEIRLNNTNQPALLINGIAQNDAYVTKLYLNNSATLSIDEHLLDDKIGIYPNPVQDVLNIKLDNSSNLEQVSIFDISGREIISSKQSEINVSHLYAGIYIVKLVDVDGAQGTKKFVKNKY